MYELRENGTHRIACDGNGCHMEVLGPTETEVQEDKERCGWVTKGTQHVCPDCAAGNPPARAVMRKAVESITGDPDTTTVQAPHPVQKGQPVYMDGVKVGTAKANAASGEPVTVEIEYPDFSVPDPSADTEPPPAPDTQPTTEPPEPEEDEPHLYFEPGKDGAEDVVTEGHEMATEPDDLSTSDPQLQGETFAAFDDLDLMFTPKKTTWSPDA